MASAAYALQLGVYRHDGGKAGLMAVR